MITKIGQRYETINPITEEKQVFVKTKNGWLLVETCKDCGNEGCSGECKINDQAKVIREDGI